MRKLFLILLIVLFAAPPAVEGDTVIQMAIVYYKYDDTSESWQSYGWYVPIRLFDEQTPGTTANFLRYMNDGWYNGTFLHRNVPGFILQGGGFAMDEDNTLYSVPTYDPIVNEYGIPNTRGTIAMAKVGGDPDSATSQFFFNLVDNSTTLGPGNNGGYTVFGHVLGSGMSAIDSLAAQATYDLSGLTVPPLGALTDTPLYEYGGSDPVNDPNVHRYVERIFFVDVLTDVDGDVNLDGLVDSDDAEIFRSYYGAATGATWLEGDFDADGDVDFADAWALMENYSGPSGSEVSMEYLTGGSVPEPTMLVMLGVGGLCALRRRRRV